jgi:hypothetical protein
MKTITVELLNSNALRLLEDLELANLIRLLDVPKKDNQKLSAKLRGVISTERANELNEQLNKIRKEWEERSI